jgi:hypothetical protein
MNKDKQPQHSPASPAGATPASGKLVKRAEAARMLGMSVSTLRRQEGRLVSPIVGPDGVHLFDESEIRSVSVTVRHKQAIASSGPAAGEIAAEVFTLLDERVHPVEIVKRLQLTPQVVVDLHEQWAQMRGGLVLNSDEVRDLAGSTRAPRAVSGRDLVGRVRTRVDALLRLKGSPACRFCRENAACACERCIIQIRGPLWSLGANLERRTGDDGAEQVRVVVEVGWDEAVGSESGTPVPLRSDWYARDQARSPIREIVEAIDERRSDGAES